MDKFTRAYITAALWSSTDESDESGGVPLDENYSPEDIAPQTMETMKADCADFQTANAELLVRWYSEAKESPERAGHDFWLTRNRHGAGFWDRWNSGTPQGVIGKQLTEASHSYGEVSLYVGDDGQIWA